MFITCKSYILFEPRIGFEPMFPEYHTDILPLNYPDLCKERIKTKNPKLFGFRFLILFFSFILLHLFYVLIKPEPVSAILFLPKSEQNVPSPMRLVVVRLDTIMYAIRFIVLFLFVIIKFFYLS